MAGFEDLEKCFNKGLTAFESSILESEGKKIGQYAIAEIKRLTPVSTGLLRRRWNAKTAKTGEGVVIYITNNTKYAPSVNYGHRVVRNGKTVGKTVGRYMLERGLKAYKRTRYKDDLIRILERLKESF